MGVPPLEKGRRISDFRFAADTIQNGPVNLGLFPESQFGTDINMVSDILAIPVVYPLIPRRIEATMQITRSNGTGRDFFMIAGVGIATPPLPTGPVAIGDYLNVLGTFLYVADAVGVRPFSSNTPPFPEGNVPWLRVLPELDPSTRTWGIDLTDALLPIIQIFCSPERPPATEGIALPFVAFASMAAPAANWNSILQLSLQYDYEVSASQVPSLGSPDDPDPRKQVTRTVFSW